MRSPEIVAVAVAGLRKRPSHGSEQTSQLLLGETFGVLERAQRGEWLRVRCDHDGYEGWLRSWHAVAPPVGAAQRWRETAQWQVRCLLAVVRRAPEAEAETLTPLPWGALLAPRRGRQPAGWIGVTLPDGRQGFLRRRDAAWKEDAPPPATSAGLQRTARIFLGVPYEWGGRSSWGMDCSGFVQTIAARHGIPLPRDARQQARALGLSRGSRRSAPEWPAKPGNIAFFGAPGHPVTHVGLAANRGRLLHALGAVRSNDLGKPSQPIEQQLLKRFLGGCPLDLS